MLSRILSALVRSVLLIPLVVFVVSCNRIERHEIMVFLLDGLKPPEPRGYSDGPSDSDCPSRAPLPVERLWYAHEPRKDCTNCHDKQRQTPGKPFFIAPVPELCYKCHTDRTVSASFVHAPAVLGQCLFCHHPHKSQIEHLLRQPIPELCYLCHDINSGESTSAHFMEQPYRCTNCHDPHASSEKALLKKDSSQCGEDLSEQSRSTL